MESQSGVFPKVSGRVKIAELYWRLISPRSQGATHSSLSACLMMVSGRGREWRTMAPYSPYSAMMLPRPHVLEVFRSFARRFWNQTCHSNRVSIIVLLLPHLRLPWPQFSAEWAGWLLVTDDDANVICWRTCPEMTEYDGSRGPGQVDTSDFDHRPDDGPGIHRTKLYHREKYEIGKWCAVEL